jgi:ribonuclease VapC
MDIVVDSSVLVAIVLDEPDAEALTCALTQAERARMTTANWLEAQMVVFARAPARHATLLQLATLLKLELVPVDADVADAAFIAYTRYGKGQHRAALNFGDCFAYALARLHDAPLLFKGDDFSQTDVRAVAHA